MTTLASKKPNGKEEVLVLTAPDSKSPQDLALEKMREPFAPNQISKMCRPTKKDNQAGKCKDCGGWHKLPSVQLSYVGHAALTDRLLDADPTWTWEPLAFASDGTPLLDKDGGMWIRLTVAGVTRLGYGDAQGKLGGDATKERIGDALRNAAMRFGAALELWHKGDLHGTEEEKPEAEAPKPTLTEDRVTELLEWLANSSDEAELTKYWLMAKTEGQDAKNMEALNRFVAAKNRRKQELGL